MKERHKLELLVQLLPSRRRLTRGAEFIPLQPAFAGQLRNEFHAPMPRFAAPFCGSAWFCGQPLSSVCP
jgi:hypothetical protein